MSTFVLSPGVPRQTETSTLACRAALCFEASIIRRITTGREAVVGTVGWILAEGIVGTGSTIGHTA